ncbi:hypothetical protein DES47_101125 [Roseateles toxinivorans]|uniref:Uncharacterized protein n=1 Tax=Roseateles toxinivorans TaxID=270368 RepID=A0A4V3CTT4_9BURK|nr:hypothetical protein DES47_101125 [Roseateles toxinivorans]
MVACLVNWRSASRFCKLFGLIRREFSEFYSKPIAGFLASYMKGYLPSYPNINQRNTYV